MKRFRMRNRTTGMKPSMELMGKGQSTLGKDGGVGATAEGQLLGLPAEPQLLSQQLQVLVGAREKVRPPGQRHQRPAPGMHSPLGGRRRRATVRELARSGGEGWRACSRQVGGLHGQGLGEAVVEQHPRQAGVRIPPSGLRQSWQRPQRTGPVGVWRRGLAIRVHACSRGLKQA